MDIKDQIKAKASSDIKTIVLPEGDEERTLKAAAILQQQKIVTPVLLGDPDTIRSAAEKAGADINGIRIINQVLMTDDDLIRIDTFRSTHTEFEQVYQERLDCCRTPLYPRQHLLQYLVVHCLLI